MSALIIELPDDLATRLTAASRQKQVPPAQIIREALEKELASSGGEGCALAALGDLVGCLENAESDLATNPKHMEGFGEWRR